MSSSVNSPLNQPVSTTPDVISDDLAHELRQPLGVIETLAYYLELTACDEKTSEHARQIQAMVSKVNSILCAASTAAVPKPVGSVSKVSTAVLTRSVAS